MYQPKHQASHQPSSSIYLNLKGAQRQEEKKREKSHLSSENAADGPPELSSRARPDARAGDGVRGDVAAVDVVLDALVGGGVEGSTSDTVGAAAARVGGAGARDLDVDALGVGLGAVLLPGRVQGDDLVAQDVVARGERLGDVDGPLVAVGDELVRGPLVGGGVDDADLGQLEEAQALLVGVGAVAGALGQVVDDRAVVGLGPGVPLEGHGAASSDGDGGLAGGGFLRCC